MRVGIATDHGGFGLKEELVTQLRAAGYEVIDFLCMGGRTVGPAVAWDPSRRSWQPTSAPPSDTCAAWAKWLR